MKSFKYLVFVGAFAALACTSLRAQSTDMRATVPFDFHAGDRLMPAGEYVIHGQGQLVYLHGEDGAIQAPVLMTIGVSSRNPYRQARLEFNRYGSEYFLTAIWNSFTEDGRRVLPTARQRELAKRSDVPVQAEVTFASGK
jgi:hypothetical protein